MASKEITSWLIGYIYIYTYHTTSKVRLTAYILVHTYIHTYHCIGLFVYIILIGNNIYIYIYTSLLYHYTTISLHIYNDGVAFLDKLHHHSSMALHLQVVFHGGHLSLQGRQRTLQALTVPAREKVVILRWLTQLAFRWCIFVWVFPCWMGWTSNKNANQLKLAWLGSGRSQKPTLGWYPHCKNNHGTVQIPGKLP